MDLTDEQQIAASEWLRQHPKIQTRLSEITFDLFYRPLIQFGAAVLAILAFDFAWFALWWKTLQVAPTWWLDVFSFMTAFSFPAFLIAIMEPSFRVRSTIIGAILLSIPYVAGLTSHVLS